VYKYKLSNIIIKKMAGDREDKTTRKRKPVSEEDDDLENPSGDEDKVKKIPPRSAWKIVGQVVLVICGLFFLYCICNKPY